jgi:hypothetical protein
MFAVQSQLLAIFTEVGSALGTGLLRSMPPHTLAQVLNLVTWRWCGRCQRPATLSLLYVPNVCGSIPAVGHLLRVGLAMGRCLLRSQQPDLMAKVHNILVVVRSKPAAGHHRFHFTFELWFQKFFHSRFWSFTIISVCFFFLKKIMERTLRYNVSERNSKDWRKVMNFKFLFLSLRFLSKLTVHRL